MKSFIINGTYIDYCLVPAFSFEWNHCRFNSGNPYKSYNIGWLFVRVFIN